MAPTKPKAPPAPPPTKSSSSASASASTDSSGEDDDEDEEEEEEKKAISSPPLSTQKHASHQKPPASYEDDGESSSGSGSDSDSGPPAAASVDVKPISSKPMDKKPKPKSVTSRTMADSKTGKKSGVAAEDVAMASSGSVSESSSDAAAAASKPTKAKRPQSASASVKQVAAPASHSKSVKRVRLGTPPPEKSQLGEDEEIAILKGMVDFMKRGSNPSTDMVSFLNLMKKSLPLSLDQAQLADTVRRLKRRYQSNVNTFKKTKSSQSFAKPHKKTIFELSQKIWGGGKDVDVDEKQSTDATYSEVVPDARSKRLVDDDLNSGSGSGKLALKESGQILDIKERNCTEPDGEKSRNGHLLKCLSGLVSEGTNKLGFDLSLIEKGLASVTGSKLRLLEDKWAEIEMAKMELFVKQNDLARLEMELILEILKAV